MDSGLATFGGARNDHAGGFRRHQAVQMQNPPRDTAGSAAPVAADA